MRKTVRVLLCMVWLMLCAALPAFGAESAPHVTAETTMAQLRANPAIQGSGYYTYCREMTPLMVERWKNKTLHDYFGDTDRESGIAALNLIIDNYNKGVKVTYQVYTPEEIEHNSSLGCVQLFYYPAETPNAKTAIVVPGNALTATSEMVRAAPRPMSCITGAMPCSCCATAPFWIWAITPRWRIWQGRCSW